MGLVAVVPLSTEGTVVNPSNTTAVQGRGVVVVVLLERGKWTSSGRFDGATWGRLPRSFGEGTVAAFDGVSLPSPVVVDRCQRRWKVPASLTWISTSVATGVAVAAVVAMFVATGVAGFPGLAIAAATWAGTRDGWKERDSIRAAHNVREGTRGTGWTDSLSFGTGSDKEFGGRQQDGPSVVVESPSPVPFLKRRGRRAPELSGNSLIALSGGFLSTIVASTILPMVGTPGPIVATCGAGIPPANSLAAVATKPLAATSSDRSDGAMFKVGPDPASEATSTKSCVGRVVTFARGSLPALDAVAVRGQSGRPAPVAGMPIEAIVPSPVELVKEQGGSVVDDTMGGPTWKGWESTMGLVAVVSLSTEEIVVNPSNTTVVQARGIVVVVLLERGKWSSSGRFDGATWGRLPRSFDEGTVAAFDGVPLPSLVVVDRCQRQ